jgi:hypothetical protein
MEPFRVFLALLVNLALVLASAFLVLYTRFKEHGAVTPAMHRFPRRSVLSIAALDALQLAVMVRFLFFTFLWGLFFICVVPFLPFWGCLCLYLYASALCVCVCLCVCL